MSIFSEQLNTIIQRQRLTLTELSQSSGLSTALISKIKTGKRLPESDARMLRLVQSLHCSLEQQNELIKEYQIEKMGRGKYLCMEECRSTLESISYSPSSITAENIELNASNLQQSILGENNIDAVIRYMLDLETASENGLLQMVVQPDASFITKHLLTSLPEKRMKTLSIEHIVALCSSDADADRKNIRAIGNCLRISCAYSTQYKAFYHYKTEFIADFFPFCILTSSCALLISMDYQNALFLQDKATLKDLQQMFDTLLSRCQPLLHATESPVGFLQCYEEMYCSGSVERASIIEISQVPCILSVIPPQIALAHIHPDLAANPYVMGFLKVYWSKVSEQSVTTIFSLDGLDLFMKTGISYELPRGSHSPFTVPERIAIIQAILQKCKTKNIIPILLKENTIRISPELSVSVLSNKRVNFIWNSGNTPFSSCIVDESTMRNGIVEFLHFVKDSSAFTYSPEESLALLTQHISQYKV